MPDDHTAANASAAGFNTTRWSYVLAAKDPATPEGDAALEELCGTYWKPLYAYLRRLGTALADAKDLVQGLFAGLLEHGGFAAVDPNRGKFRSFLLACLKHHVANERDRGQTQKRGGRCLIVPLHEAQVDEHLLAAPELSPDAAYEQTWAMALIENTVRRLRREYEMSGKGEVFTTLEPYLTINQDAPPYSEAGARLNLGESAVKMTVLRMRRRFGELLRTEVAKTVDRADEVDGEIRALFASLRR